jgi:hypothetical protein
MFSRGGYKDNGIVPQCKLLTTILHPSLYIKKKV